jgi:hypothetical protein
VGQLIDFRRFAIPRRIGPIACSPGMVAGRLSTFLGCRGTIIGCRLTIACRLGGQLFLSC